MKKLILLSCILCYTTMNSQSSWLNECKKGLVKEYHENGKLYYTGVKSNDCNEIGEWKFYYENGRLKEVENYNNDGDAHGKWEAYWENGQILESGYYAKDEKTGLWQRFYENGQIMEKINYKNGVKSGDYITYFENGNICYIGAYKDGLQTGLHISYYPNSILKSQINYKQGDVSGQAEYYDNKGKLLPPNQTIAYDDEYYTILDKSFKVNGKEVKASFIDYGKPTEYYYNGQIKSEYELKDEYCILKTYYQNGNIKSVYNKDYDTRFDSSYISLSTGQRIGITKEYDEQGNLIKETDEDYTFAVEQMKSASKDAKYREYRYQQAHKLFLKSAQRGNKDAESFLGYMYDIGLGVSINHQIAKDWYTKSCDKNNYNACQNLGALIIANNNAIAEEMNSLGTTEAENLRYDKLKKQRLDMFKEALPYLEKSYSGDKSNAELKQTILSIKNAINGN